MKNSKWGAIVLMSVMLFAGALAHAAEFHVTTATELTSALSTAQGNGQADVIYLSAGTYVCSQMWGFRYNSLDGDGKIYLMAESGVSPSDVVLDGDNKNAMPVLTIADQNNASEIRVQGITIQNGASYAAMELVTIGGDITIDNCIIKNNSTNYIGVVIGTAVIDGIPTGGTITFSGNTVTNNVGGVNLSAKTVNITGNQITQNTGGGGVDAGAGTVILTNNVIAGNTDEKGGGASLTTADSGEIILTNNTIVENESSTTGGGVHVLLLSGESAYFYNNIIRGNSAVNAGDDIHLTAADGSRTEGYNNNYSGIQGQWDVADGNRDVDSGFVDPTNSNWHLLASSVLIDEGKNGALHLPSTDKDGNQRKIDGDGDGTKTVDIGAYEYDPSPSRGDDDDDDDTCFISTLSTSSAGVSTARERNH